MSILSTGARRAAFGRSSDCPFRREVVLPLRPWRRDRALEAVLSGRPIQPKIDAFFTALPEFLPCSQSGGVIAPGGSLYGRSVVAQQPTTQDDYVALLETRDSIALVGRLEYEESAMT